MEQLNYADYQPLSNCEKRIFMRIGGTDVGQLLGQRGTMLRLAYQQVMKRIFVFVPNFFTMFLQVNGTIKPCLLSAT
jgi:hypothetical protein